MATCHIRYLGSALSEEKVGSLKSTNLLVPYLPMNTYIGIPVPISMHPPSIQRLNIQNIWSSTGKAREGQYGYINISIARFTHEGCKHFLFLRVFKATTPPWASVQRQQ